MTDYVWFITATSSGFGEAIAFDALRRGHKVIATARDSSKLDKLRAAGAAVMDLDVTCDEETLAAKLAEANAIYGKITHVASCAGYILEGTVEEASAKEVYNEFNTNVFGVCNIARAVTPYLREAAKSGQQTALANFGSLGSWLSSAAVAHLPDLPNYKFKKTNHFERRQQTDCSTKFAVTGLTEGLADELKPFGIDVCDIEPGYTRTGFLASGEAGGRDGRVKTARKLPVYGGTHPAAAVRDNMNAYNGKQPNDVTKSARLIVDVLTRTGVAEGKGVPIRLVLGQDCLDVARKKCADTLRLLDEWAHVSKMAVGDE
ncbi:hypothetical protein B0H66DRAFT_526753 [Apodospora peruviana]|uniref:Uncharacterized protein n=1 Tax=Apodospora peruviana TaxID=516989 RepID=A0AAE0IQZ5_9PEZI|nr:hypothetical protein B0H66DRAFT_526753 [Apodospora peruviana]